ncbi:hypothetical protein C3L33_20807, partial [Rhododendron williamsianum]
MKGKTPEQVGEVFHIVNDFTQKEVEISESSDMTGFFSYGLPLMEERNSRVFPHRGSPVEAVILTIEGDMRAGLMGWKKLPFSMENTRLGTTYLEYA